MATISTSDNTAPAGFVFRLYVAGEAPNSVLALRNLRALCQAHHVDNFHVEVVDVLLNPERAWADGILVTPTTMRLAPVPQVQIIGNLADTERVLYALGIVADDPG